MSINLIVQSHRDARDLNFKCPPCYSRDFLASALSCNAVQNQLGLSLWQMSNLRGYICNNKISTLSVIFENTWIFFLFLCAGTNSRSPGKTALGHPGRTIKDYEDQLSILQKENFNLKLRVYFLEEKMGFSSADENTIKKNIELNVRKFLVNHYYLLIYLLLQFTYILLI